MLSSANQVQIGVESGFWNFPNYIPNFFTQSGDLPWTCVPPGRENWRSISPWSTFPLMEPSKLSNGSNLLSSSPRNGVSSGIVNEMPYSFKNISSRFQSSIPERDHQKLASNVNKEASGFRLEHVAASAFRKHSFPKSPMKFEKRKIHGGRNGPLGASKARKTAIVRANGACWRCRLTKSSV
jgi:hypothetical protein